MTTKERKDLLMERCNKSLGKEIVSQEMMEWLNKNGFFVAPASTKHHCDYEGGLFDHSLSVMETLKEMTRLMSLTWEREESPYIVGMFHDLCKIDHYKRGENKGWEWNEKTILKGHGEKSVVLLAQFVTLTEEEICCIRYHMGIFTKDYEWNDFTRAVRKFPNVLWTHNADMYATHVLEEIDSASFAKYIGRAVRRGVEDGLMQGGGKI